MHQFVLRGYFEMADDLTSETTWQTKLTAVMDTLIPRRQIAAVGDTARFEDTEQLDIRFMGTSQVGGVYCHVAEIVWILKERLQNIAYKGVSS